MQPTPMKIAPGRRWQDGALAPRQAAAEMPCRSRPAAETPMTHAQAETLRTVCAEAGHPRAFDRSLSAGQARGLIEAMRELVRLRHLPPHTD